MTMSRSRENVIGFAILSIVLGTAGAVCTSVGRDQRAKVDRAQEDMETWAHGLGLEVGQEVEIKGDPRPGLITGITWRGVAVRIPTRPGFWSTAYTTVTRRPDELRLRRERSGR